MKHSPRTLVRRIVPVAAAAAITWAGLAAPAQAQDPAHEPPRTPGLDEVFNGYVVGAMTEGRMGSPEEIFEALQPGDPFYDEPVLRGDEAPGTLLAAQPVTVQFTGYQPGNLRAWKLMYVTTDIDGQTRDISTGILMIPDDGRDDATRPIIGYQEANDSVGAYCHPSTQWTGGAPLDGASWSALGPLALLFGKGYAVMITDVGNDGDPEPHGVFAGKFAGHSNLDGLRAALAVDEAGLGADSPISLFGIAGGGVGAAFAAEAHDDYAPELNIRSTVLEGMVVNQKNFLATADGSIGSGFGFATLLGLEPKYPEMRIDEKLNPAGKALADYYRTQCQTPAYFTAPFLPLNTLFTSGLHPADIPEFQHVYEDNQLGTRAPRSDVLIASCAADDSPMSLVPAQDARDLADKYRAGGTEVTYAPTDCSMIRFLTDLYGWGTDLFGMQTVPWLASTLEP
ncbi:lipase [Rhodococcus triatomae]|uniref:Secretory lipase n=1 Tax=Rhodococcus triatomae TaxID=300028 RepID=A0A1G8AQ12_9NOCA|nr:lipase family protein [Rhodococcus triatomae]QNG17701.1 lipase [Rhodococcus triatomae]QNG22632.1 lipase [Rhodococcus triatomae]SDH23101.1 Secretory lipase [Rhodococcus triatomae]